MGEGEVRSTENDQEQVDVPRQGETHELEAGEAPLDSAAVEEVLSETDQLQREADRWREKAEEYLDKYRRGAAEFANYRKRQDRERAESALRTSAQVMRQLLPVVDDLERAISNIPGEFAADGWVEGVLLIDRKLKSVLEQFQVVPIEALGKPFDPYFHSALVRCESNEQPAGTVVEELERGYMIGDRVLRPTIVKVSTGPEQESEAGPGLDGQVAE